MPLTDPPKMPEVYVGNGIAYLTDPVPDGLELWIRICDAGNPDRSQRVGEWQRITLTDPVPLPEDRPERMLLVEQRIRDNRVALASKTPVGLNRKQRRAAAARARRRRL